MTSLVLGVVGAVVGGFVGGPTGAQIGFALGSAIGGAVDAANNPIRNFGPRVSDLKVQASTWGGMLPIYYGAMRGAGNVIWSTPIKETANTTSQGGKGGPSVETTTYTYSVSLAVSLGEGLIVDVRKIWAYGRLIYNVDVTASAETLMASQATALGFKVYPGSETQLPDPTIEADKGIGNVPAYRGQAYIVFTDFQLADYGNRIPNFEFEVVAAGTSSQYRVITTALGLPVKFASYSTNFAGKPVILSQSGAIVRVGNLINNNVYLYNLAGSYIGQETRNINEPFQPTTPIGMVNGVMLQYNDLTQSIGTGKVFLQASPFYPAGMPWAPIGIPSAEFLGAAAISADGNKLMVMTAPNNTALSGYAVINKWYILNADGTLVSQGTVSPAIDMSRIGFGASGTNASYPFMTCSLESDLTHLWTAYGAGSGDVTLWQIDNTGNLVVAHVFTAGVPIPTASYTSVFADQGVAFVVVQDALATFSRLQAVTNSGVSLASIVTDQCIRAGLQVGDIDVSTLTDNVTGYRIATVATARANIEPLQKAFYVDAVESDNIIKFPKRGSRSLVTIPLADLAAHTSGGSPSDPVAIQRLQETDLPARVTVNFVNQDADYLIGSEAARRLVTQSKQQAIEEMPIAMSKDRAQQIADVLMYDAYVSRSTFSFQTSRKYAKYEPTDVVDVVNATATYRLRITKKDASGALVKFSAVANDSTVYTAPAVGSTNQAPQVQIVLPGPTRVEFLDIPILRDGDDSTGLYVAMGGYKTAWQGATLFRAPDNLAYVGLQSVAHSATMGTCTTALGNWTGGNVWDEVNSITVILTSGTLSSHTRLEVLNGANVMAVGNEIIQFRAATLIATNQYTLSGLLRGRRGTEQYMGAHAANERAVLLGVPGTIRPNEGVAAIGAIRYYKPVSVGAHVANVGSIAFTNAANGSKPYTPTHLSGGKQTNGDFIINWIRRGRIDNGWRDAVDVPLGETTESYEVDIMSGTTVMRTLASSAPTVTYTAAMQTTDFGSTQSTVTANIYQKSSVVGRGFPANKTY